MIENRLTGSEVVICRKLLCFMELELLFHVEYNGKKALIDINDACVLQGALPSRQLKLVLAWCVIHQDELMQNWELAKDGKPLNRINPLV